MLSETGQELMDQVFSAALAITTAEAALHDAVGHARQAQISWAIIGAALGVSRQAAQERFSRPAPGRLIWPPLRATKIDTTPQRPGQWPVDPDRCRATQSTVHYPLKISAHNT